MSESKPCRPEQVPPEACWDGNDREWYLGLEENGLKRGPWKWWRPDGNLWCESFYDENGKLHGKCTRYHPDGTISLECDMINGLQGATSLYKSEHKTDEAWSGEAENIVRIEILSNRPGIASSFKYFTKDGSEVDQKGKPLWPRPKNVPEDAMFVSQRCQWVQGQQTQGTGLLVGSWTWWEGSGRLLSQRQFNENNNPIWEKSFSTDGTVHEYHTIDPETGKTVESITYQMTVETIVDDKGHQQLLSHSSTMKEKEKRFTKEGQPLSLKMYDKQGEVESEINWEYRGQQLVKREDKGKGGALIGKGAYDDQAKGFYYTVFYPQGNPLASGEIANALLVGSWQFHSNDGKTTESHVITAQKEKDANLQPDEYRTVVSKFQYIWTRARLEKFMNEAPMPDVLAGVEAINWNEVEGCWGEDVAKFPRLLKSITSEDRAVQKLAQGIIFDECCHQTSTYEATGRVIPFYIRLLAHPTVHRAGILEDLIEFGDRCRPDDVQEWGREQKPGSPEWMSVMGVLEGLAKGEPVFLQLADDKDPQVRKSAIALLKFSKDKAAHATLLTKAARFDPDRETRIHSASELIMQGKEQAPAQKDLLDSDDFMMRSIVAMTMAYTLGDQTPKEVFVVLKEAFERGVTDQSVVEEYNHFRVDSVMGMAGFLAHVVLALGAMRSAEAMAMIPKLCKHIDDMDSLSVITYGQGLLSLALGDGNKTMAKEFMSVLETLTESKKFYTYVNVNDVLDMWRLPHNVVELKALIAELKSAPDPEKALFKKLGCSIT